MSDTIKQALYAAVGRRKMGALEYEIQQAGHKFRCQVTLSGINYVGMGVSTSKKDAQTNAARDLSQHLIREGLIAPADIPELYSGQVASTSFASVVEEDIDNPYAAGFDTQSQSSNFSGFERPYQQAPKSYYEEYVQQRAEEIEKSEAVDLTSGIHGGWNLANCKKALNEFLQARRMQAPTYKTRRNESLNNANFVSELEIYVSDLQRKIRGRGEASTKKNAEAECALTIVRQLYHLGMVKKSNEPVNTKKKNVQDLPPIKVLIDDTILQRLTKYLQDVGLQDVTNIDYSIATPDARITLLTDQRLSEFATTEKPKKASLISFSPPTQNWNPWRSSNIDEGPMASMSMEEISNELLMQEKAKIHDPAIVQKRRSLPVFNHRREILKVIEENSVVLIKGTTGCGKSTQVCQFLMDDYLHTGRGAHFNCFVSQPRRISAISLAERVANERCEQIGESVGFSVRFESVTPRPHGAVVFVTVGTLLKKLEYGLRGVSHLIIDEIHERDINTDFILIIVRDMVRAYPTLKVVLMSATIETGMFTNYFKTSAVVNIEQRVFSVHHFFLEDVIGMLNYQPPEMDERKKKKRKKDTTEQPNVDNEDEELGTVDEKNLNLEVGTEVPDLVKQALSRMDERQIPVDVILQLLLDICYNGQDGSVLVFLPGWSTIQSALSTFQSHPVLGDSSKYLILPLHSQLPFTEQRKIFQTVGNTQRKIILSTNIAETSITIDDVVYVIDSCRAREKMHTSRNNMVHYATVWASRNSMIQRRGRAGRVREGFCFHLCTRARYNMLDEHRTAEMLRTPLHEVTLMIKLLRLGAVGDFLERAIEPPPLDAIIEAEVLLREMGALDSELELTPLGRIVARLPVDPKIGKAIILGAAFNIGDMMCTIAAATSLNSPFIPLDRLQNKLAICHRRFSGRRLSDHVGVIKANNDFAQQSEIGRMAEGTYCSRYNLSSIVLSMTSEAKLQMRDILAHNSGFPEFLFSPDSIDVEGNDPQIDILLGLLVYAFYPNVCYTGGDKRRVFTLEQATALMSKVSVCFPMRQGEINFSSPLLVFTEKIRTSVISAKQLSMITPLHLLLFGSRRVECVGPKTVRLDDMILLDILPEVAAKLVALRPCIESLIIRATTEPSVLEERSELDKELEYLIRQLCGENAWCGSQAQNNQHPPVPYVEYQQRNRGRHHHQGKGQRTQPPPRERPIQYPDQRTSGFGRGGYRRGFRGGERPVYSSETGGFRGREDRGLRRKGISYENRSYGASSTFNRGGQQSFYRGGYGAPVTLSQNQQPYKSNTVHGNHREISPKRPRNDEEWTLRETYSTRNHFIVRGQVDRKVYEDELPLAHVSFSRDYDGQALGVMREFRQIAPSLIDGLGEMSVKHPTPIQSLMLPYLFETNLDLNVSARHGTGKTLAYLIAILDYVCRVKQEIKYRPGSSVSNQPLAVIILPNSFLVKEVVSRIKALNSNIQVWYDFTGAKKCECGTECDVYVGTIGKVKSNFVSSDGISMPSILVNRLEFIVLDDVNKKGHIRQFLDDIAIRPKCRVINVSSNDRDPGDLGRIFRGACANLVIRNWWKLSNIKQEILPLRPEEDKLRKLHEIYIDTKSAGQTLIFVKDKLVGESILNYLAVNFSSKEAGFGLLETDVSNPRNYNFKFKNLDKFREGELTTLIVAGGHNVHGLNLPGVNVVINYTLPNGSYDYILKISRCGRMYNPGRAITFFDIMEDRTSKKIHDIIQVLKESRQDKAATILKPYE